MRYLSLSDCLHLNPIDRYYHAHYVSIIDGQSNATDKDLANVAIAFLTSGGGVVGTGDYAVAAQSSPNNTVQVAVGRAYVPTSDGTMVYSTLLDAIGSVTITANSSGVAQIDTIVLYIDLSVSPDANADNVAKFADVRGTAGVAPTNSQILTAIGSSNPYISLANIAVANGFVSINNSNITDERQIASFKTGASVPVQTYADFTNQSGSVAQPSSGIVRVYSKTTDKKLYYKDDTGTETVVDSFTLNPPQGFLQNGKIVVSVSGNNLTLALKTLAGVDPSATDTVYLRIGNTVQSVTAALSVTKNAGTNWCDAGSSELATQEVDYFVYLGYNATDGVVLGFSRIPWATQYGDFSTTTTNDAYAGISTITNAVSSDYYENVGRFAATLSAGAGYTWTVPTFTPLNQAQSPVYETRWLTWTPVHTGFSSGPTGFTTKYKIRGMKGSGEMLAFMEGTTGGTSNATTWTMTVPYPTLNGNFFTGYKKDNGGSYGMAVHTSQAASKIFNLYAGTGLGDGWTASGNKNALFQETIFQIA